MGQVDEDIMNSVNKSAIDIHDTGLLAEAFRQAGLSTLCHVVATQTDSSSSGPHYDDDLKAFTSLTSKLTSLKTTTSDDHKMLVEIKDKLNEPAARGEKRGKFLESTGAFTEKLMAGCNAADPAAIV